MEDEIIDLRGTRCPLTLLKMKQCMFSGGVHEVTFIFDDAGAARDLPVYLRGQPWVCEIKAQEQGFIAQCKKEVVK